jgi:hypothetical protein
MTQLFDPVEHQPLDKRPWSESEARAVIAMLVDETVAAWHPQHWWPPHPDEDGVEDLAISEPHLYMGASGLVLALDSLGGTDTKEPSDSTLPALPKQLPAIFQATSLRCHGTSPDRLGQFLLPPS